MKNIMKTYEINGNQCYTIAGELAIDTNGDPVFAACEDWNTIVELLGIDEIAAVKLIEEKGEEVDYMELNSIGIRKWGIGWSDYTD